MYIRQLPDSPEAAVSQLDYLGSTTTVIAQAAIERLWFEAAKTLADGSVFISTGDIPAMWIRDSVWQVRPLIRFVEDVEVATFIEGVIKRQIQYLGVDPYANAFNIEPSGFCWHKDFENQSPWVFERKFELDSWTGFLHLSLDLADAGITSHLTPEWWEVAGRLVDLMEQETEHDPKSYRLIREGNPPHDYLSNDGYGAPYSNCGLIWSGFRPSDDAVELPFHVPSNIHASLVLERLAIAAKLENSELASKSLALSKSIWAALEKHCVQNWNGKEVWAYEVDGQGSANLMDDANYPSLLSLPFLGLDADERYLNTRELVWSKANPWFFEGNRAKGVGSPHTGQGMVWPLAIAMFGLTAESAQERLASLRALEEIVVAGSFVPESVNVTNPETYTRDWFSWAEMTYVELALKCLEDLKRGGHPGESNS